MSVLYAGGDVSATVRRAVANDRCPKWEINFLYNFQCLKWVYVRVRMSIVRRKKIDNLENSWSQSVVLNYSLAETRRTK